eukprot:GHVR01167403.1.p1 GENE.GHVR01167403.1~~GHVR01167403.1.p1  ORF type:complete len:162 (+),score=36.91 GHVR01167403.1:23-508(+)
MNKVLTWRTLNRSVRCTIGGCGLLSTRHHYNKLFDQNLNKITVNFIKKNGDVISCKGPEGATVLEVAHANHIDIEGACEGALACSTCHVISKTDSQYESLCTYFELTEAEEDLLDLAPGLTNTSRLCCQLKLFDKIDGFSFLLPVNTRNFYVDKPNVPTAH